MKIFLNYLNDYKILIILWISFGLINIFIGFLYQLPLESFILWFSICGFISIIAGIFHFNQYYRKYKNLIMLQKQTQVELEALHSPRNLIESEYQILVKELNAAFFQLENKKIQNEEELLDYFTMWVHQIKVPISALYLILQDEDNDISAEMGEQLFKIEQYVEMILQYIRLESVSTDYQFQNIDLDSVIREIIKKHAPIFIRKKLSIQYKETNQKILTDSKWLAFVLEQILSNALKYTNAGTISIYFEDNAIVIKDTGIGIRPEDIPRIGEKNFTGFTGRKHKSASGMGLYLSKQILKQLGHKLEIESELYQGTTVKIIFET
ncbi:HAMP domain-containing sensor histidine kinase [Salinicoccus sp. YB14-2]|uniref:sensor histidine kinase n=1 Tax=Salinicoccus sp. YB14-2 TaxID=1572701 RepID=UPI00068BCA42|nr:sensor histidine kinase [Salinicoccus sp. YB14-2]